MLLVLYMEYRARMVHSLIAHMTFCYEDWLAAVSEESAITGQSIELLCNFPAWSPYSMGTH
jgi:hypothetical protein